uniref:piwi-like protein 3 n=1 Tax=Myodes glareolus TaxID=447135 RepID=UPI002021E14E|nr:piwi-like protein 3 [Myodes glareolus]
MSSHPSLELGYRSPPHHHLGHRGKARRLHQRNLEEQKAGFHFQVRSDWRDVAWPPGFLWSEHHPTAITKEQTQRPCGIYQDLVVNTRKEMKHVKDSKRGTEGKVINLQTNHYQVTCGCEIAYKYNIDYQPDIEDFNIRTSLLLRHESILGKFHIFDGNSLLLPQRLQHLEMELVSQTKGDEKVRIRIRLSSELHPNHPDWLRYYNILFGKMLKQKKLEELDSNPGDLRDITVMLQGTSMDIQRSYNASILPYERSLTLCADVTHRLHQTKTVLDILREKSEVPNEEVSKELVGSIVYTLYNNKTYRIDDISWDKHPDDTFKKSDGSMISFKDYYWERHQEKISSLDQPLLMSLGRWRKGQMSTPREPIFLVPQLCKLTDEDHKAKVGSPAARRSPGFQFHKEKRRTYKLAGSGKGTVQEGTGDANLSSVVCVLPDNRKQRYEEIKTFLCVEKPVPSQCVVASTLNHGKNLTTVVTKIAQQMNCKMGGALWKVDTRMEKTMFIGIDCFHDIVNRQKSVAAFVASTKEDLTMWHSQCLFQDTAQEIVGDLRSCLQAALDSWVANEKQEPQSVVVYRDGVGDGQLQALLVNEVRQFQKFFASRWPEDFKLTFIVVKKRINTRFFYDNGEEVTNPPSGTVVDQVVTRDEWYDFYIVSQTSNSGTVTPTHYNVIYDTKGLTPNQVQCLTYRLCHMYYNLPGIIRVPAPCHYAHRLAYFVGKSIRQKPASALSDYLYYL